MIRNFKDGFVVGFFCCVCLLVVLAVGALLHAQSDTSYGISEATNVMVSMSERLDFSLCCDTKPLSARNDVLVFQTPPLTNDTEVTGRLIVKLWASSNALDTDFTAKLVDAYPPNADFPAGVDLNVADSIVRARYRNGFG